VVQQPGAIARFEPWRLTHERQDDTPVSLAAELGHDTAASSQSPFHLT
jgi:hypothetical protein